MGHLQSISAVTLMVADMARSVRFYRSLGFELSNGGPDARFTTMQVGSQYLNLMVGGEPARRSGWGRVIIHVRDVDEVYRTTVAAGHHPEAAPEDASWGERYFHVEDPDGHEISFARPLDA